MRLVACVFMVGVMLPVRFLHAEIVLDDFDEPFEIILSGFPNPSYGTQPDIGPLSARRWRGVSALSSRPTGRIDANLSRPSSLNLEIDALHPTTQGYLGSAALNLRYDFDETDVTEGGVNDRVAIDFAALQSAVSLAQIGVSFGSLDGARIYPRGIALHDIPVNDKPFTVEFPFAAFYLPGAVPHETDFQNVSHLSMHILVNRFIGVDAIDFSASIERIRFGSTSVPEPSAAAFSVFWGALLVYSRRPRLPIGGTACV